MASVIAGDDNFDSEQVIAQNQAWTDKTSDRVGSQTYTNETGRPIQLSVGLNTSGPGGRTLTIDSISIPRNIPNGADSGCHFDVIIPAGSTYSLNGSFTYWFELTS